MQYWSFVVETWLRFMYIVLPEKNSKEITLNFLKYSSSKVKYLIVWLMIWGKFETYWVCESMLTHEFIKNEILPEAMSKIVKYWEL